MQTFLFSPPSYLWALRLCLLIPAPLPCTSPTLPQQRQRKAQPQGISPRWSFLEPWGCGSTDWAGAEGCLFFTDNNVMTLQRHSSLEVSNWALWTLQHQLWFAVYECGWVCQVTVPWLSSLIALIPVCQRKNLPWGRLEHLLVDIICCVSGYFQLVNTGVTLQTSAV